jgi:uncharacterized membrane protein YccF (DUF307 family)
VKTLGNLLWLLFGGLAIAIEYLIASLVLFISIIGIPFGLQTIKLVSLAIWPFGKSIVQNPQSSGCLNTLMNVVWLLIGGIWICLSHLIFGIILCITIIGIPFGKQHFKLAGVALTPFGKEVR